MDSLTQVVLGAAVGEAVLGKKIGNRAILWGAIGATIPDLDIVLKYFFDEITAIQMHRGFSHSLVFAILISPFLGWVTNKIHKKLHDVSFKDWSIMFFMVVITHPLLDAHTTWGTQLFWPFEYRLAYQNIYVVDPFYTLPFLLFVIITMFFKRNHPKRKLFNLIGLIVSSIYMLLTISFKYISHISFKNQLNKEKIEYLELNTKPTPLNSILWNALVETENGFITAYYSLFDSKEIQFSREFKKNHQLLNPYKHQKVIQQLIEISNGWYYVEKSNNELLFWDMRFGQSGLDPNNSPYIWCYKLSPDEFGEISVNRMEPKFDKMDEIIKSIYLRAKGN